jgi:hypothetical protein
MPNLIKPLVGTTVQPACTIASLANGAGRISAQIDNSTIRAPRGKLGVKITTGGVAPTANAVIKVYIIRAVGTLQGGTIGSVPGTADAALTIEPINDECVATIQVRATANDLLEGIYDVENPGPAFSFAPWNASGQALNASGHLLEWTPITDEVQ